MIFSIDQFERFCRYLRIDSKERGQIPFAWTSAQRYFVEEVARGLNEGVHTFLVLKARQLGISTICLALDLYWMFLHKGLQGVLVTDTDDNREGFKSQLAQYIDSLPAKARVPVEAHNRVQLVLTNRSKCSYIVAGKRQNQSLGAGKAANFMHATECAAWGDEEGLKSLIATLAQQNPQRLFIFESTAYGFNMWYEMCEAAKTASSQRFIFIGWWRNEFYTVKRDSVQFRTYWDGSPTTDEREWIREVFEEYHYEVTPEQIAWWRWILEENCSGDLNVMYQQYPPTANYAFQMSGSKFFSGERVNISFKNAITETSTYHRYKFGLHFEQTEFIDTSEENAEVKIWEMPQEGAEYVMGADPAYGSSEWADLFAISIWRCFADRLVQVAEVATPDWTPATYAWAMTHLAGSYRPCMVALELQGPGLTTYNEMQNLRRFTTSVPNDPRRDIYNVVYGIRDYLWRKADSISGSFQPQWKTTATLKVDMMENFRSYFERDMLLFRSTELLQEMRNISRDGDKIGGEGRAKDDRVIAAGLAIKAWNDWLRPQLQAQNRTYAIEMQPKGTPRIVQPVERAVLRYLGKNGIRGYGASQ